MQPEHTTRLPVALRTLVVLGTLGLIAAVLIPGVTPIAAAGIMTIYFSIGVLISTIPAAVYYHTPKTN